MKEKSAKILLIEYAILCKVVFLILAQDQTASHLSQTDLTFS